MKAKKIPPGGGTPSGAYQAGVESSCQHRHPTISAGEMQEAILKLLRHGAENALTLSDLSNVTGFDPRAIRRAIHKARREGIPILSDNEHGYFYPGSASEKRKFVRSMRHRAAQILAVARAVESGVAT